MNNAHRLDLAGPWSVALDPDERGKREGWFRTIRYAPESPGVQADLPGSTDHAGLGDPVHGAACAHPVRRHAYVGGAWWQRWCEIPAAWAGQRIELRLERVHWACTAYLDGVKLGTRDSLSAPQIFILPASTTPGRKLLSLLIDNRHRLDLGIWGENAVAHSIGDHTQPNWNGVAGSLDLCARPPVCLERVEVRPQDDLRTIAIRVVIGNDVRATGATSIDLAVAGTSAASSIAVDLDGMPEQIVEARLDCGSGLATWDEHAPTCHTLTARIASSAGSETVRTTFGLRRIAVDGRRILLNGRPLHLRGTLECCLFPDSGLPPTDLPSWQRIMRRAKEWSLNHLRFHSWCPPSAAFAAADAAGMLLQVEAPLWAIPGGDDAVDRYLLDESRRIIEAHGNHPSFILFSAGNEPGGQRRDQALDRWLRAVGGDGRFLCTAGSGWPEHPRSHFHCLPGGTGRPGAAPSLRLNEWNQGPDNAFGLRYAGTRTAFMAGVLARSKPMICHEIGQWCAYPDLAAIPRYDRSILRPSHLERCRDHARARGLLPLAERFLHASGQLQLLAYKEEIEAHLRTPGIAGFQLLGLTDFTGQGNATVGVLDAFWEPKPYADAAAWRRFCAPTVALASFDRHCWSDDDTMLVDLLAAHSGATPVSGATVTWRLRRPDGGVHAEGHLTVDLPLGTGLPIGQVAIGLQGIATPAACRLEVAIHSTGVELAANDWPIFCYPRQTAPTPAGVHVTTRLDAMTMARLAAGGRVLLCNDGGSGLPDTDGGFGPIFWNTNWAAGQKPDLLGLLIDPAHPALAGFPTGTASDWQWHDPCMHARPVVLNGLPGLTPIVRVIDDWYQHRQLALLAEARVGDGHLVVCALDLTGDLSNRPAARQLRQSLLAWLDGGPELPASNLDPGLLAGDASI